MNRLSLFYLCISIIISDSFSQKQDYNFITGYDSFNQGSDSLIGTSLFTFENETLSLKKFLVEANFRRSSSFISSPEGKLLYYTDGFRVWGEDHQLVPGLEEINRDNYFWNSSTGFNVAQQIIILPNEPNYNFIYTFFDKPLADTVVRPNVLRSTLISKEGSKSKIYHNDLNIDTNRYSFGMLTATRHANGRDWWLVAPLMYSPDLLVYLIQKNLIRFHHREKFNLPTASNGTGSACFSPNGRYYASVNFYPQYKTGGLLTIYDFDRCEGKLRNKRTNYLQDWGGTSGLAFSQNSKYLYYNTLWSLYRINPFDIDLELNIHRIDSANAKENDPFGCVFGLMYLAPDGKIYMASAGPLNCLSIIDYPDEDNIKNIGWRRDGIRIPTYNARSLTNTPYIRLGPEDGTLCDSLGINNVPLARFRYEIDSLDKSRVRFINLSDYNPKQFSWNFGDAVTSIERSPYHKYDKSGPYNVCLTASNEFGSNYTCKPVRINLTNTTNNIKSEFQNFKVFHENGGIRIISNKSHSELTSFILTNLSGQVVMAEQLNSEETFIETKNIESGSYFYQLADSRSKLLNGKLAIIK